MGKVLQNLSFSNPQNAGEVPYREFFFSEQLRDSLPDGQDRPPLKRLFTRPVTFCPVTRPEIDLGAGPFRRHVKLFGAEPRFALTTCDLFVEDNL